MEDKEYSGKQPLPEDIKKEKANWNIKPYLAVALLAFIVFCLCMAVFFVILRFDGVKNNWGTLQRVMQPITIGLVIAYLINPMMKFIERHMQKLLKKKLSNTKKVQKISRTVGTFGALIIFILIIFLLLAMLLPQLSQSISGVVTTLPSQVNHFIDYTDTFLKGDSEWATMLEETLRRATEFVEDWFTNSFLPDIQMYVTEITSGVINVMKVLLNVVVGLIIAVYVLLSKEKFIGQSKKIIYAMFPAKGANVVIRTLRKSNEIFGGFISGKILDSVIIGILCYFVLSIIQMPYTVLVSVIVGITNIIPFFGPFIGAVPSIIIIALADPIKGLYFIIFVFVLQQVDGNIIGPKILGDSTGLSSFWVVFAILVGGGLFGFAGMILGVPVFAVIYYVVSQMVSFILRRRRLPETTDEYIYALRVNPETNEVLYSQQQYKETLEQTSQEKTDEKKD